MRNRVATYWLSAKENTMSFYVVSPGLVNRAHALHKIAGTVDITQAWPL